MEKDVLKRLVEQHKSCFCDPNKPDFLTQRDAYKEENETRAAQERIWAKESFEQMSADLAEVVSALEAAGFKNLRLEASDNRLQLALHDPKGRNKSCTIVLQPNQWFDFKTEISVTMPGFSEEKYFCYGQDLWKYHPTGPSKGEGEYKSPTQDELDKHNTKYTSSSLIERFMSIIQEFKAQEKA